MAPMTEWKCTGCGKIWNINLYLYSIKPFECVRCATKRPIEEIGNGEVKLKQSHKREYTSERKYIQKHSKRLSKQIDRQRKNDSCDQAILASKISPNCVICGLSCSDGLSLSNGEVYHQTCYNDLRQDIESFDKNILDQQQKISLLESRIRKAQSIVSRLKRLFFDEDTNVYILESEIARLKKYIYKLESYKNKKSQILSNVYDYWPTYPPDWEERKLLLETSGDACEKCGTFRLDLHAHHRVPISSGGSHRIENLVLLCERCHRKKHKDKEFSYSETSRPGSFHSRVELLRAAMRNGEIVRFSYRKYDGTKSVRSIRPESFKRMGESNSLCVTGYCYLRGAERVFAVKRMKGAKIVTEPGKCYEK